MMRTNRVSAAWRAMGLFAAVVLLFSLGANLGCRRKEAASTPAAGAVYYEGPMKPKGGGAAAPANPR